MRRVFCVMLCLLLLSSFVSAAKNETLAEQIDKYIEENGLTEENFALSYFNTETEAKYNFNEHTFFSAGDVWTLPLHMYYCLEESKDAFLPEENDPEYRNENYEYRINGMNLDTCRIESILNGNREVDQAMRAEIMQYENVINEEFGHVEAERLPESYYTDNCYSAYFLMNCMKELELDLTAKIYGDLILLYAQRPTNNEGFKSDSRTLTNKYTTVQIRGEENGMVCAVAEVAAPDPYLLVCFVSEKAGGDRVMAELNELICSYIESVSRNGGGELAEVTDNKSSSAERTERALQMTGKTSNDFSGLWVWFLCALGGAGAVAALLYGLDILLKYIKRKRRKKNK